MAKTMAEVIHEAHCLERVHNGDCMFWEDDAISAAALSAAGYGLVADAKREAELRGELIAKIEYLTDAAVNIHRRLALRDEIREVLRPRKASNDDQ